MNSAASISAIILSMALALLALSSAPGHSASIQFTDETLNYGIDTQHQQTSNRLSALNETLGSGVCVFDYDNDGWQDIFLVGGSGHTRFYGKKSWWNKPNGNVLHKNINGKYFSDVTALAGLSRTTWGMGCITGDLDNDGDIDLFITTNGENILYENKGNATFNEVTKTANIFGNSWSTGASLADINNDGLLDIYITNFIDFAKGARTFEFNAGFDGNLMTSFNPAIFDGVANQLYINQGNLTFIESAQTLGIDDPAGRGLGGFWLDVNGDEREDLLVVNESGSPSQLYINKNDHFVKSSLEYSIDTPHGIHGAAIGDLNNDGAIDIIATNSSGSAPLALVSNIQRQGLRDLSWDLNIAQEKNLALNGWGVVAADFNNDRWVDLFFANGMSTPDIDTPHTTQAQPNQFFISQQGKSFTLVDSEIENLPSRSVVTADFDNDGDIDIFVTNNNEMGTLLINNTQTQNRWIGIDLLSKSGRHAMGASVTVDFSNQKTSRTNRSAQTFLGNSDYRIHIGLGEATKNNTLISRLTVNWEDGKTTRLKNIETNQYIRIDQTTKQFTPLSYSLQTTEPRIFNLKPSFVPLKDDYAQWLAQTPLSPKQSKQLAQYFSSADISHKKSLIKTLIRHQKVPNQNFISALKQSLKSDDVELLRLGIDLAKGYEFESSVYWLISLLDHPSNNIVCAASKTFEHFFKEEEAVTHKKYLAVAPLIQLLQHKEEAVVTCALDALAESEQYRAVLPIGKLTRAAPHLNPDQEIEPRSLTLRLAAIRALGRIRDRDANRYLLDILNSNHESAELIASTLTALKRLKHPKIDQLAAQHLDVSSVNPHNDIAHAISIASALILLQEEHTVIDPKRVSNYFFNALDLTDINILSNAQHHQALEALSLTHNTRTITHLKKSLKSQAPDIRLHAYKALINNGTKQAISTAVAGLYDKTLDTKNDAIANSVLQMLSNKNVTLDSATLKQLIDKSPLELRVLTLANTKTPLPLPFSRQLSNTIAHSKTASALKQLLSICQTKPNSKIAIQYSSYKKLQGLSLLPEALSCGISQSFEGINKDQAKTVIKNSLNADSKTTQQNIKILARSTQPWVRKQLLQFIYHQPLHPQNVNEFLNSSSHDSIAWNTFLKKSLAIDNDSIRENTLSLIAEHRLNNLSNDIKNILKNPKETLPIRKMAAKSLLNFDPDYTLNYLITHE